MQCRTGAVRIHAISSTAMQFRPQFRGLIPSAHLKPPKPFMSLPISCNTRIPNTTDGSQPRYSQAKKAVENCSCDWVDENDHLKGIKRLTLSEAIAKRNELAKLSAPLPSKEIPGIVDTTPKPKESHRLCLEALYIAGKGKQRDHLFTPLGCVDSKPQFAEL